MESGKVFSGRCLFDSQAATVTRRLRLRRDNRAMDALTALRDEVARITRRGIGMTLAACLYWLGLAVVTAWAGLKSQPLAIFFLIATAAVYPLGWLLDRFCGGDLLARGHPFSGLILVQAGIQALGWPMLAVLFRNDPLLLPFALATMLGAHFVPFGWLYRSPAYTAVGVGSIAVATFLQWWRPLQAHVWIPAAMALCYAIGAAAVVRELRGVSERGG